MPHRETRARRLCRYYRKEDLVDFPGFLPTDEPLKIGDYVLAQFVCISNNRILLTSRFSHINLSRKLIPYIDWEDKLDDLDNEKGGVEQPDNGLIAEPGDEAALTEEEAAFRVWAGQVVPQKVPLRRATDLLLPAPNPEDIQTFTIAEHDLEWLITDLEGGMRSGCLKASSESVRSRSGMLLYRGRCVGCIYGNKQMPESPPSEEALGHTLMDLGLPDTKVTLYDLPENLVLASSALFLGHPAERKKDEDDARTYFDYTLLWLAEQKHTACLCLEIQATNPPKHCFVYIYRGQYAGAFYVEDQTVTTEKKRVYEILQEDPQAGIRSTNSTARDDINSYSLRL